MKLSFYITILLLLTLGLTFEGCVTDSKAKKGKNDILVEKQKKYDALLLALGDGFIHKGTPGVTIRSLYGNPDDNFSSGSTTGSAEVWTYYKVPDPKIPDEFQAIRLYFNNSKLIDWTY